MNSNNELKSLIGQNEKIFYEGKPDLKCYIFECIFNPLLPVALIWGFSDIGGLNSISVLISQPELDISFIIIYLIMHLMPVWMYLVGILFTYRRYKNTYYIVTDKAIYSSEGIFNKIYKTKPFAELSHIDLHRGIFDQLFNVGDTIPTSSIYGNYRQNNKTYSGITLNSISNYTEVYSIIKKLQQDIYTDVMYPNDLRPKENSGYNTEYKGL